MLAARLYAIELFRDLGAEARLALADAFETMDLAPGATLAERGRSLDCLYVVREGQAELALPAGREVVALRAGDCVGELALVYDFPQPATVTAPCGLRAMRLTRAALSSVLGRLRGRRAPPSTPRRGSRKRRVAEAGYLRRVRRGRAILVQGTPIGQLLHQAAGHAALRHDGGEGMLLVAPLGTAHAAQLLLRHPHQPVGSHVERAVDVRRALLNLDGPRPRHPQGQVALLRLAAVAVVLPHFDAQLGCLVVVEAAQRLEHVLLRIALQPGADSHLLALDDELHAAKLRTGPRRRSALTLLRSLC